MSPIPQKNAWPSAILEHLMQWVLRALAEGGQERHVLFQEAMLEGRVVEELDLAGDPQSARRARGPPPLKKQISVLGFAFSWW